MADTLGLRATWNHDPLPASEQVSVAYLLVDITEAPAPEPTSTPAPDTDAPASPSATRYLGGAGEQQQAAAPSAQPTTEKGTYTALNVSLVLDTSGSMAGAKLQNLKAAVRWVIDHLSAHDRISITLFDDEVHPLVAGTLMSQAEGGAKGMLGRIERVREAGGTAMSKGLVVGLDEAVKGAAPGMVSRIIVLTDGQTWGDADKCKELAAQAGAAGIPITAMGLGAEEDWSVDLLDALAGLSGGLTAYIARPEEIRAAFESTIRAMQNTTARNLRLSFNPAGGVKVRAIYKVAPLISRLWPEPGSPEGAAREATPEPASAPVIVPLGDIQQGEAQSILYEVILPPRRPGTYRLARLLLKYTEAAGNSESDTALDLTAAFEAGRVQTPGDPRVMNSVEKATAFKLQTRALQASMLGDAVGATRNLRAAATRLLNLGETGLAQAAEQEAQKIEANGAKSSAGTKRLVFETRRLAAAETADTAASTVRFEEQEQEQEQTQ